MYAKLSALFVAGVMVVAAGSSTQAQDYFRPGWSSGPAWSATNNYRNPSVGWGNGIAVGGCYSGNNGCSSGNGGCNSGYGSASRWGGGSYGSVWSHDRWDNRYVGYGSALPYRSPSYLPVYRSTTYNTPFNHSLPGYGHTSWNVGHGSYR